MSEPSHDPSALIAACPAPLLVVDQGDRVRFASPAACALWADDPIGASLEDLLQLIRPRGGDRFEALLPDVGGQRRFDVHAVPLPSGGERLFLLHDVTKQTRVLARLQRLALSDPLTRLANRRGFERALRTEHRRTLRAGQPLSLLALDVNGLKTHNDRYGHAAGDLWLRAVARALRAACRRPGDVAARIGGDEFAVLLPETDADGARAMARRIDSLLIEHQIGDAEPASVAIGAASLRPRHADAMPAARAALRRAADIALYTAKLAVGNSQAEGGSHADADGGVPPD